MTTYTYTGFHLRFDIDTDDFLSIVATTLRFVTADANNSFTYDDIGVPLDGDDPIVNFTSPDPYHRLVDGAEADNKYEFSMLEVSWGSGNLTYMMAIFNESANAYEDYLFYLGGTAIPNFSTTAEFESFDASVITSASISSGPLAEGQVISYDSLPGVVITEKDTIRGNGQNNEFHGGAGNDKIYGAGGRDKLYGDAGKDKLFGQAGNDKLFGGGGADVLNGGGSGDLLKGNAGNDKLIGGSGADVLQGGGGNDALFGGDKKDVLIGGKGADTLSGGKGNDDLRGNAGADVFLYSGANNEGTDSIFDFEDGIDVFNIGGGVTFGDIVLIDDLFATIVTWNSTSVSLFGVNVGDIGEDDFSFI